MNKDKKQQYRLEEDSMGKLKVPVDALWGAQTQRAVNNFPISGQTMPRQFIRALGLIKQAAAKVNADLGHLSKPRATAINKAAKQLINGKVDAHFPIDIYQTGSGTSSNMNANEVITHLANAGRKKALIHPNDHVNMGQSSNDVIPTAMQVGANLQLEEDLLPALEHLAKTLKVRAQELKNEVKTGRTHLMDAMPVTFGQELMAWAEQVNANIERLKSAQKRLRKLPQGGTAVGTGINADPKFAAGVAAALTEFTGVKFERAKNLFVGISSLDIAVELSGQLKTTSVSLLKIANDLRWMNSGPLAGIGEIELEALQPGSSIMPGKVNPVIPEATAMVCARVAGNDATITTAGQSGNFQLNVMLPVAIASLTESIMLLSNVSRLLADKAISSFKIRRDRIDEALSRNPILVTALNSVIGYELGAATAKQAYKEGRPILEVARETTGLSEAELKRLLEPLKLTKGGIAS